MAREIKGSIYKLTYTATWHNLVECSSKQDLFEYVAKEIVAGQFVTGVVEMCKDGSTPRIKVHTDKEFKKILNQMMELNSGKIMTRNEMIDFIKKNHNVKVKHEHFSPEEYIYSKPSGEVYTEEGYLFEDWYGCHNGIRMRKGDSWETGWSLYKEN